MVKNIIFDLGGVLMWLNPDEAMRRFESLGITDAREQMNIFGQTGLFLLLENGTISADEFCHMLAKEAQTKGGRFPDEENPAFTYDEMQWAWKGYIKEVPQHLLDYILTLKDKYRLCLLSNTNPFLQDWVRSDDFSKAGQPLTHYLDDLFCSYELNDYKPALSIFEKALKQGNIKAEESIFLDDSQRNIEAAEKVGLHGLLVGKDEDWREALEQKLSELNEI